MERRFKILAVDDEPINIRLITAALKGDYDIITALNGHDAIDLLAEQKPDLVLLDVMMPDLSGFDVCKIIKTEEMYVDIPVIFLTALDTLEGQLQGFELGGIDYLSKPINFTLLRLRVRNHLELKRRNDLIKEQRDLLEAALARVKQLEGVIPICAYCKKIRDDKQNWHQLERYITDHSDAMFSHGACPECAAEQMEKIRKMKLGSGS
jgi:PleD family two-component response regulator